MLPGWMKWTIVVSVILIALACISNTIYNIWFAEDNSPSVTATISEADDTDSIMNAPISVDSVETQPVQHSSIPSTSQLAPNNQV